MRNFIIILVVTLLSVLVWVNLISPWLNDEPSNFFFKGPGFFRNTDVGPKTNIGGRISLKDHLDLEKKYDDLLKKINILSKKVGSSSVLEYDYSGLEDRFSDIQVNQKIYPSLDGDPTFALRIIAALDTRFGKTPEKVLEQLERKKERMTDAKWTKYVLRQNRRMKYLVTRSYWTWFAFLLPNYENFSCFKEAEKFHESPEFLYSVRRHLGEMSMGRHLYRVNSRIKNLAEDLKVSVRVAKRRQSKKKVIVKVIDSNKSDSGEAAVKVVGSEVNNSGSVSFKVTGSDAGDSGKVTVKVAGSEDDSSGSVSFKVTGSGCNLNDCSNQ